MSRRRGGSSGSGIKAFMRRDIARWQAEQRAINEDSSNWSPSGGSDPQVGFVRNDEGEDHLVSFKLGQGSYEGHTLIADGALSAKEFDGQDGQKGHDHFGPRREGGGYFATHRGRYTGPSA